MNSQICSGTVVYSGSMVRYRGDFNEGKPEGKGTMEWPD